MRQLKYTIFVLLFLQLALGEQLSINISPSVIEQDVRSGQKFKTEIEITNMGNKEINIESVITDFRINENGSLFFKKGISDRSCAGWLKHTPEKLSLSKGESKKITLTSTIPYVKGGGYYAALLFKTDDQALNAKSGINVNVMPGVIINLVLPIGKKIDASVGEFTIKNEKSQTVFTSVLFNKGNIHFRPNGSIVIYDSADKIIDRLTLDKNNFLLPGSKRVFRFIWDNSQKRVANQMFKAECRYSIKGLGKVLKSENFFSTMQP